MNKSVLFLHLGSDVFQGVADGLEFVCFLIRDADAELFLDRVHQLVRVEAVGAQVLAEGRVSQVLRYGKNQDAAHRGLQFRFLCGS